MTIHRLFPRHADDQARMDRLQHLGVTASPNEPYDPLALSRGFISALHRGGYYDPPEKSPDDAFLADRIDEIIEATHTAALDEFDKIQNDALIHGQGWGRYGPDGFKHIPLQVIQTQPPRFWRRQWQRFTDCRARIAYRVRAWWYRFF